MPAWCNEAPFDPEGSVSTLNAILSTIIGCHFGHVFVQIKGHAARLYHMVIFSVVQVLLGLLLHFSNVIRMNTDLYSFSYVLVSGGAGGIALSICYCIVDCKKVWAAGWRPVTTCSLFPIHFVLGNSRTLLGCSVPCVCERVACVRACVCVCVCACVRVSVCECTYCWYGIVCKFVSSWQHLVYADVRHSDDS